MITVADQSYDRGDWMSKFDLKQKPYANLCTRFWYGSDTLV